MCPWHSTSCHRALITWPSAFFLMGIGCIFEFRVSLFMFDCMCFSWWSVYIKVSLCSWEARPGLCCWILRKPKKKMRENMRYVMPRLIFGLDNKCPFWQTHFYDIPTFHFGFSENEAAGSQLLNWDQTDRPGCQQNLQEPHYVHGAFWSKVSSLQVRYKQFFSLHTNRTNALRGFLSPLL